MAHQVKRLKLRIFPFRGTLAPLSNSDYRLLLSSNILWWQTTFMEMIVMGWLALELTDSAWQVALIGFYRSLPFLFAGFVSGPIIDRFGRRNVILGALTANLLISTTITLLLWLDRLLFWHLALGAVLMGAAWALDWPARRALVPDLVGREQTLDAMLLENFAQNISRILGPFISGSLIEFFGARGCYTVLAGITGLSLLLLLGLSKQPIPRLTKPPQSPWAHVGEGLRYVRHNQPILGVLLVTMVMNLMIFPYMSLLPVFARDILQQGPIGLGLLGAASGVGAFIGLFLISRIRHLVSHGWIFALGSCFQSLALLGFATSTTFTVSLILLMLSGIGHACFGTMQSSIILLAASDEMRSRAMGTLVLAIGAGPPGRLEMGALAEAIGAPWAVGLNAALSALSIIFIAAALPDFRQKTVERREAPTLIVTDR